MKRALRADEKSDTMKPPAGLIWRSLWHVTLGACVAAGALANAQDSTGGWKRVGESSQVYNPVQNADPNNQAPDTSMQPPPVPNNGRGTYPSINSGQQQPQQSYAPPPVPAQLTMQAGTYITARINQTLSSDNNQPGDAFTASLVQPLVVNGVVVAEPGQTLGGRVVTAEKHHYDRPARLGVALTDITLVDGQHIPVNTQFVSRQGGTTPTGQEIGTVAATAGVGAAIGAIAGWGTGAAIGAGAGAAAGLIGVLVTHNHASVLYPEQVLTFKLESPVTISTLNSAQAFRYVQPNEYDRPVYTNSNGNGVYQSAAPAPPVVYNTYPYYGGWGWGYPYYWGPSIAFYGGWYGGYPRYYYGGHGYYGGHAYYGGHYSGGRGFSSGGGYHGGHR